MKRVPYFIAAVILFSEILLASKSKIENYTVVHFCYLSSRQKEMAVIRVFKNSGQEFFLTADTETLNTDIIPAFKAERRECGNSRYEKLLKRASSAPYPLQNDGITHGRNGGVFLTTDLCPSSKKGYERRLYRYLIEHFPNPVPVTLFITGRWITAHRKAFEELKKWNKDGNLSITWGNHTYLHTYHPGKALERNFVLSPEVDLSSEIVELEKNLIENGIVPSIFFRFPGLISKRRSVETVTAYGLITIGSDAWLAKGEKPKEGSIILVHGNRNEPAGVDMLLKYIKQGDSDKLCDLRSIVLPPEIIKDKNMHSTDENRSSDPLPEQYDTIMKSNR